MFPLCILFQHTLVQLKSWITSKDVKLDLTVASEAGHGREQPSGIRFCIYNFCPRCSGVVFV